MNSLLVKETGGSSFLCSIINIIEVFSNSTGISKIKHSIRKMSKIAMEKRRIYTVNIEIL